MKKTNKYKLSSNIDDIKIQERLIPLECSNRNFGYQVPRYIVIHETELGISKYPAMYNMEYYEKKIIDDGMRGSTIGYHYLVGDKSIYHFIPDTEKSHHVGCAINNCSIGIERLVCEGISFCDALHNQAKLAATLMVKYSIPLSNVIFHKTAQILCGKENPKQCPNRMIVGQYGGFSLFKKEIKKCLKFRNLFFELLIYDYEFTDDDIKKLILEK